jgi:endonuclease-3 related protein
MSSFLQQAYQRLFDAFGPQHWWPGETPLEVMIGAVLTQNTAWTNVERAIDNLRDASLLDAHRLHALPAEELAELIRPAGYFRLKARRLWNLLDLIVTGYDGSLEALFSLSQQDLTERLLSVNGVGPETADSIVLYAAQMPAFVVDAYTARVLKRHGWIEPEAGYHDIQALFVENLEEDVQMFNEYHALLVNVGKTFCRKSPRCESCPLCDMLPADGPVELNR